jgi:hypothetical protein
MSFKVSNIILDEIHKSTANQVEVVSGTATLDPSVPTTKINATSSYQLYLPKGKVGQQKIITIVDGSSSVTINYNNGYSSGVPSDITLSTRGDMLIMWASVNGWHYRSYID